MRRRHIIDKTRLHYLTTQPAEFPLRCGSHYLSVEPAGDLPALGRLRQREIIARQWFKIDELPQEIDPLRAIIMREFADHLLLLQMVDTDRKSI